MNDENINQGAKRFKGLVKWFNDAKGFGFIQHEDGQDVFVHYSVIEQDGFRTLKDGEEVEYEMKPSDKGLQACKVSRINKTEIEIIKTDSKEEGSNIPLSLSSESADENQNPN